MHIYIIFRTCGTRFYKICTTVRALDYGCFIVEYTLLSAIKLAWCSRDWLLHRVRSRQRSAAAMPPYFSVRPSFVVSRLLLTGPSRQHSACIGVRASTPAPWTCETVPLGPIGLRGRKHVDDDADPLGHRWTGN